MVAVAIAATLAGAVAEDDRCRRRSEDEARLRIRTAAALRRAEAADRRRKEVFQHIAHLRGQVAENVRQARKNWDHPEAVARIVRYDEECRDVLAAEGRWAAHYTKLRAKHLDVASHPWLPDTPGPPEPE
jgi:hypothetical protein